MEEPLLLFDDLPSCRLFKSGAMISGQFYDAEQALELLKLRPHIVCHAGFVIDRLVLAAKLPKAQKSLKLQAAHFDVAELFAFICPAQFATPTPSGLLRLLMHQPGHEFSSKERALDLEEEDCLAHIARLLLEKLVQPHFPHRRETAQQASFLERVKWPWAPFVLGVLQKAYPQLTVDPFATGLQSWERLQEWEEESSARTSLSQQALGADDVLQRLQEILGTAAEKREQQYAYTAAILSSFAPRQRVEENHIMLAEAGTGLGKTLAYLVPSFLWARQNKSTVWISTYTKNLQRQIACESQRLSAAECGKPPHIVIRKGRENYACLLNIVEVFSRLMTSPRGSVLAALIARWVRVSRDGDLVGGDFPAWIFLLFQDVLGESIRGELTPINLGITDRRGECLHNACQYYRKCFIERAARMARKADLVIANHAVLLSQAMPDPVAEVLAENHASSQPDQQDERQGPRRIIFDEGHQLFDAADNAFSSHFTGGESAELRRWIRGSETGLRRGRGLLDRMNDLNDGQIEGQELLEEIISASKILPEAGWSRRLQEDHCQGESELFFSFVRAQVLARSQTDHSYEREVPCLPMIDGLAKAAHDLWVGLRALQKPMMLLAHLWMGRLDRQAAHLTSTERFRLEAGARSLLRRSKGLIGGWIAMLTHLLEKPDPLFVEWFSLSYHYERESDVGMHCHWIDPTKLLAENVFSQADGVLITSATLKDRRLDIPDDWRSAEMRTGVTHLPFVVKRATYESPFDYHKHARIMVINDIARSRIEQLGAAYRELFLASHGGALGIFTAISRLRAVHGHIAVPLAQAGVPLYAQHVDQADTGTLVDMFAAEHNSCLLGTDAVRDGMDVPGPSLRLVVLDRVPWSPRSLLENARREAFGKQAYEDMMVRLRLRQAFGRLIRRADDRGCFIILDNRFSSRFASAFPEGMTIERFGLAQAINEVRQFFS